jgi:hypothetical protein
LKRGHEKLKDFVEVDPPMEAYIFHLPKGYDPEAPEIELMPGEELVKVELIDGYFFRYYSNQAKTFFRVMFLNIKLSDSKALESHPIREFLFSYAPHAITLFHSFLEYNFQTSLSNKLRDLIFKGQTKKEIGDR